MGRPKGSKNKVKDVIAVPPEHSAPVVDVPIIGLEVKKKERKASLPTKSEWILTETAYGTPIAIESIIKSGSSHYFMVIPHHKERESKTTTDSISVIKPEFPNPEVAKEFEGIKFFDPATVKKPVEPVEESKVEEPVNDAGSTLNA